nr:keratin, type II cytoskeletal 80 isoform X2 [Taeniopygia guttata]
MTNPSSAFSSGSLSSGEAAARMSPDGGASDGHGSVGSDGHGSVGSDGHGSVGSDGHGSPGSHGHGSPGSHGHGSPGSHGHGSPGSHGHGSPGSHGHGSPGSHGHGSPGILQSSPGSDGHGSPGSHGHGSPGILRGSPGILRGSPRSPLPGQGKLPPAVRLDIDTEFQAVRQQEKEDIKVLNNQFVTLIEKVQSLEQQNKILTTRWNFLKDQDNSHSDSDIKAIYEQYVSKMNQEMKALNYEQENLESELTKVLSTMDTFRSKYEDEIRLCSGMEFTFMELKKDLDVSTLHRTELEVKLKGLQELLELKKTIYEQELEELLTEIKDISVVLGIDSCSRPDLGRIVEDVRAQYEALALRSWEEAEALTRRKVPGPCSVLGEAGKDRRDWPGNSWISEDGRDGLALGMEEGQGTIRDQLWMVNPGFCYSGLSTLEEPSGDGKCPSSSSKSRNVTGPRSHSQRGWERAPDLSPGNPGDARALLSLSPQLTDSSSQSGSFGGHLLDSRREIADLNIRIQKLRSCIVSQKSQCLYLEEHIREAGEQGEGTLRDAKAKVAGLEEALQRSREHMAQLVREYQELMNIKLALDVEILTYRKLVEGEENSMEQPIPTVISAVHSRPKPLSASTLRNSRLFAQGSGHVEPSRGGPGRAQDVPGTAATRTQPKFSSGAAGECS